jgi:hypothetical protein
MRDDSPVRDSSKRLGAWFLGPKAENAEVEEKLMNFIFQDYSHWRRNYDQSDGRRELVDWNDDLAQKIAEMLAAFGSLSPAFGTTLPKILALPAPKRRTHPARRRLGA